MPWTWRRTGQTPPAYTGTRTTDKGVVDGNAVITLLTPSDVPPHTPVPDWPVWQMHVKDAEGTAKFDGGLDADDHVTLRRDNPAETRGWLQSNAETYTVPQIRIRAEEVADSQLDV